MSIQFWSSVLTQPVPHTPSNDHSLTPTLKERLMCTHTSNLTSCINKSNDPENRIDGDNLKETVHPQSLLYLWNHHVIILFRMSCPEHPNNLTKCKKYGDRKGQKIRVDEHSFSALLYNEFNVEAVSCSNSFLTRKRRLVLEYQSLLSHAAVSC